jgi:hypothetical protein
MTDITIHGRSAYTSLITRVTNGTQVDLSTSTIYFEVPEAKLRVLCLPDAIDPLSLRVTLTRPQVEMLSPARSVYAIVDETNLPSVVATGAIGRTGYTGAPNA